MSTLSSFRVDKGERLSGSHLTSPQIIPSTANPRQFGGLFLALVTAAILTWASQMLSILGVTCLSLSPRVSYCRAACRRKCGRGAAFSAKGIGKSRLSERGTALSTILSRGPLSNRPDFARNPAEPESAAPRHPLHDIVFS